MKTVVLALLLAVVASAPLSQTEEELPFGLLKDTRVTPKDGAYSTDLETISGVAIQETGSLDEEGKNVIRGVFRFPKGDGTFGEVRYVADKNGFQPQSDLLPVAPAFPHPIPKHAIEQIAYAEEQRRLEALKKKEEQE